MMGIEKIFAIALVSFVLSCSPDEESNPKPPISTIPEIKIEKITPIDVKQFETITFEISYIDGDGDIGTEDADDHPLEILDNRDNILNTFHIPPQAPGSGISISGVLVVDLENIVLLDQLNTTEVVTFNVRLKDVSGNWSNTATSETMTVTK